MSLQTDKRNLNLKLARYMTLLSNLSNPPAEYINDVDYLRGLVQIADQREFQGLTQTWETIRPKDARSMRYIETGVLGDGRAVELKGLLGLAEDILIFRGGPTSGNWSHSGRKGQRGGSGRGGGFKRIGVRDGKKAGRKGIKRASRQTRTKRERGHGGGAPERGKAIPAAVLGRAKGDVARAKKTRDKDLKTVRKSSVDIEKSRAAATKAQQTHFNSIGKERVAFKKSNDASDKLIKKRDEVSDFLNLGQNFLDPKVKAKAARLRKQSEALERKAGKANDVFQAASKKTDADKVKNDEADQRFNDALAKSKGAKKTKDVMGAFEKDTEAASRIMFQNNLNEAKAVRSQVKNRNKEAAREIKSLETSLAVLDTQITDARAFATSKGFDEQSSRKLFNLSQEAFSTQDKLRKKKRQSSEDARSLLKVDNPTTIRQAPGSQKDKVGDPRRKNRREQGQTAFQDLVSEDVVPKGSLVKYRNTDTGRAFQSGEEVSEVHMDVFSGADTVVHELGHTAENYNPRLLRRSIEFRNRRTAGEDYQPLSDLTGNQGYREQEKAKPDKFIHPYMGKDYGERASEIFSMGIEEMFRDPVDFAEKDPEMFDFIYAQARTP